MVTVIIIINFAIALFSLYIAYQLWQIRCALAETARVVALWERNTHLALALAPDHLTQQWADLQSLRQQYQRLYPQLQRARQLLTLLSFLGSFIRSRPRRGERGWCGFWRRP